ncbi:YcnI family protein [Mycobacterium sp. 1423905.2]|uniref:YcnI family copper-binding membrane protein n=1 Tax=Mycobacterium sp. 1423905.2 TaxID=1856859 RepID=UPI0020A440C9|nr:DUF1775 domain-containing protein [Mycobacterium sp. 1423905.2]
MSGVVALWLGSAVVASPAWAHVRASSDNAVRGAMAMVTFQVPNESTTGAATTGLTVVLPDVASARAETITGWTVAVDRDGGRVRSVTWSAVPNGGVPMDQFGLFRIALLLPDTDTVSFPTTQTYSDGTSVKWDQPPSPGGGEPEHPVPLLTLTSGPAAAPHASPTATNPHVTPKDQPRSRADNTARWLGGAALIIGAMGTGLALRRRT